MSTHRWILTVAAVGIVIALYSLPKVVVDNDAQDTNITEEHDTPDQLHTFSISADDSLRLVSLRNSLLRSEDIKKSAIFADSLASLFLRLNQLDSAVRYADLIRSLAKTDVNNRLAGEIYFKAFGFSVDGKLAKKYADKAAETFNSVLQENPDDPDIKSKLAMTLVTTSNPMQGINMLREVLNDYPDNVTALYNLGVLSMQSGQHDKAVGRFERLVELEPDNLQAAFYLGVSYLEIGNESKAREWLVKVKQMDNDPAIHEAVDNYLKDINEF